MDDDRFGHSLELRDGDIVLDGGALEVVRGERNLRQALLVRISTPFGSDQFNVNYGLDVQQAFIEPGNLRRVKDLIRLNLVRTVGTDPRVREVREVIFEDEPRYRELHPDASDTELRGDRIRRGWRVDMVVETVKNQAETLSVRVGA